MKLLVLLSVLLLASCDYFSGFKYEYQGHFCKDAVESACGITLYQCEFGQTIYCVRGVNKYAP